MNDPQALRGIHAFLARRGLLLGELLVYVGATPLWFAWNVPPANTRSPSAGRFRATPPTSAAEAKASPETTSTSASTASRSPGPGILSQTVSVTITGLGLTTIGTSVFAVVAPHASRWASFPLTPDSARAPSTRLSATAWVRLSMRDGCTH